MSKLEIFDAVLCPDLKTKVSIGVCLAGCKYCKGYSIEERSIECIFKLEKE